MKKNFALVLVFVLASSLWNGLRADNLLAFPGAEGFGRFATGARTSGTPTIYHVTNLNDSGTGSFRDAVSSPNRIIVFDVGGVIKLTSTLVFSSNLTILGQTAPGEGVQLYGDRVSFSGANNIIVRYMRIRMGIGGTSGKDAAGVANGRNMIFDHLSVLWGRDECFSVNWDSKGTEPTDITIQNSIIGQGLQTHSCGGLMQTSGGVTLFRNLYIENKTRNPKVKGLNQYINNVVYNWGNGGCYIMGGDSEGTSWADIENNYFIKGKWDGATAPFVNGNENFNAFLSGNWYDSNANGTLDGHEMTPSENNGGSNVIASLEALDAISTCPKAHPAITQKMSAPDALKWIIDSVGPCLPVRDEVDKYLIDELVSYGINSTTGGISTERTLPHGGTGNLFTGSKPKDSDNDAMPDEYEKSVGLNPNDASDAVKIASNGYTNLENYSFTILSAYPYIKGVTNFKVSAREMTSITLSWTDNADNETGYQIEISKDGKNWDEPRYLKANTATYTFTELQKATTYYFRVRASNASLDSDYSSVLSSTTKDNPNPPTACTTPSPEDGGSVGSESITTLTWKNSTNTDYGTVKYDVYWGTDAANLEKKASAITATSLSVGKPQAGKTYYWRVDATNDIGTTTGTVWSYTAMNGGIIFQTDFNTKPDGWKSKYGSITTNTNIIYAANATSTVGGMTFGTGANKVRICAMSGNNCSSSTSSDYGPYTEADAGATARCVQFVTASAGGYVKMPEIQGPCTITLWAGNPGGKNTLSFKLNTIVGGSESTATTFTMQPAKRIFKFSYTYKDNKKVQFKIDANGKQININDIIIEKYLVPGDANNDGTVDVADITAVASYILGITPEAWNSTNADANQDGTIDVADITAIASIILSGN